MMLGLVFRRPRLFFIAPPGLQSPPFVGAADGLRMHVRPYRHFPASARRKAGADPLVPVIEGKVLTWLAVHGAILRSNVRVQTLCERPESFTTPGYRFAIGIKLWDRAGRMPVPDDTTTRS